MIITCPNCNKKFNIDAKLIPEKGRLLQCSGCDHKWHYKIIQNDSAIKKNDNLQNNNDKNVPVNNSSKEIKNNKPKVKTNNIVKEKNISKKSIDKKYFYKDSLNILLIIIITFIALILILDTFKIYISNYIPFIIPLLDNLYQSCLDLFSIIKDLFD